MTLFARWFTTKKKGNAAAALWLLTEKEHQRAQVLDEFCETIRSHYDDLSNIADDIASLGYAAAAKILKEQLPTTAKARSGELAEIMAIEFVEEKLGFKVPIRRIRYKDGREMALRGDDIIGVIYRSSSDELLLLKGESKSNMKLSKAVVKEARRALDRDEGRCTPISLMFVAKRLLEGTNADTKLGRKLRDQIALKTLPAEFIHHAFFSLTGNDAEAILLEDLKSADSDRTQNVINIRIVDHQDYIKDTYQKVAELGDD